MALWLCWSERAEVKNKIIMPILGLIALLTISVFWIKELTKLPNFDIFETLEDEEDL